MKLLRLFSELSIGRLAGLAVLLSIAYYFMYFDDGSSIETQIAAVNSQLQVENGKRVEIEKKMKKEEEMRGNNLQLARNLDVVKSKIPNEFKESEMSAIVNRVSGVSGVKIIVLTRQPNGAAARPAQGTGAELIEEVGFDILMNGTFSSIIQFAELLSKEEKIIKIRNFIIEKNSQGPDDNLIKFKGEIVGFKQSAASLTKPAGEK